MNDNPNDRRWRELCAAILEEPDPVRLQYLAEMLNTELEKRETKMLERYKSASESQAGAECLAASAHATVHSPPIISGDPLKPYRRRKPPQSSMGKLRETAMSFPVVRL